MFEGFQRADIETQGTTIHLVKGGDGPPLLLLHGYPQTHAMWHRVAPRLAEHFTVVAPDLRGYGDSSAPPTVPDHTTYSKRAMAQDQVDVMQGLGFERFAVVGHDRGARVAYRLALDHPERIVRLVTLDIVPTYTTFAAMTMASTMATFHWFFLAQPYDLPERLIGAAPDYYLKTMLARWSGGGLSAFAPEALAEYVRGFDAATIHASCEDYRAGATVDFALDQADLGHRRIACPMMVLWGTGRRNRHGDILGEWRKWADDVRGRGLDCGHFLPEEAPEETCREVVPFLSA